MKTYKVAELQGALLDAAVAKADPNGPDIEIDHKAGVCRMRDEWRAPYRPSTEWARGGVIIERESIGLVTGSLPGRPLPWVAIICGQRDVSARAEQPLVAAMRAFVIAKLGPEVEL